MNTILITGANRGIGLELAKQYADAEWKVFACCRDPQKARELNQLAAQKNNISILKLDVTNSDDRHQAAQTLKNEPIDILFNNAGILSAGKEFGDFNADEWLQLFKTNTIAPILFALELLPSLEKGNKKIIANMSSGYGSIELIESSEHCMYRTSKVALNAATRCMAMAHKNMINVMIDPGWVQTDMGGEEAPLTVQESVSGIKKVLDGLSIKDNGSFIRHDGKKMPW